MLRFCMQECETCIAVKEELQTAKIHNDELLEAMQEKNRSVIHLLQNQINRPGGRWRPVQKQKYKNKNIHINLMKQKTSNTDLIEKVPYYLNWNESVQPVWAS